MLGTHNIVFVLIRVYFYLNTYLNSPEELKSRIQYCILRQILKTFQNVLLTCYTLPFFYQT